MRLGWVHFTCRSQPGGWGPFARRLPSDAKYDCENVYVWFEVTVPDGLRLNVSRKQPVDEDSEADEPFRIRASGYRKVDELGNRLAACLRTTIYYGEVTYLGGDDFRYKEATRFEPSA